MKQDTFKFERPYVALAMLLAAGQVAADTPVVVDVPPLNRDANLIVNGSFEEGHPGEVAGPPASPSMDSIYWALVEDGPHNPFGRGDLALFPDAEKTPPGWTGSGGESNYAEWTSQWPAIPAFGIGPTGPAFSTAPIEGTYSVYFGNYLINGIDAPQDGIEVTGDGEWIFHDETGERIDPIIVPGQSFTVGSQEFPAGTFRPEVRLSQTVTNVCYGATYRLSFTAFGELGHPDFIEAVGGPLAADGFFGLEISGYDVTYLSIPAGSGRGPSGNPSPFGNASEHTYTVEFVARTAEELDITFINWGHFSRNTELNGVPYQRPPGLSETSELVLDDVVLNQVSSCNCDLALDKTCRVDPPPPISLGKCEGKLQQFTLTWNGTGTIDDISVFNGTGTSATGPVSPGDEVVVAGPFSNNDVILTFSGGNYGQSKFHVSCSDDDFNGSNDCGKDAGDGKGSNSGFDNTWLLEGFIDKNGDVLDCNPEFSGEFTDSCSFPAPPAPSCASLKDAGEHLSSLTLLYTGNGCPGNNSQDEGKVSCSGSIDSGLPVAVTSLDGLAVSPSTVMPGDAFTLSGNFSSNTEVELRNSGGTEAIEFHTSCSQPLVVGDSFGHMTVVGINGQDGGADVTYQYRITNHGDPVADVEVNDDLLGSIGAIPFLGTGESETLSALARVLGTTVNTATAVGTLYDGNECMSPSDSVMIETIAPTCDDDSSDDDSSDDDSSDDDSSDDDSSDNDSSDDDSSDDDSSDDDSTDDDSDDD